MLVILVLAVHRHLLHQRALAYHHIWLLSLPHYASVCGGSSTSVPSMSHHKKAIEHALEQAEKKARRIYDYIMGGECRSGES